MKYAGEREGVKRLAMKVIARAIQEGDLRFSFEADYPMWIALACEDEKRIRRKIFEGLQRRRIEYEWKRS